MDEEIDDTPDIAPTTGIDTNDALPMEMSSSGYMDSDTSSDSEGRRDSNEPYTNNDRSKDSKSTE